MKKKLFGNNINPACAYCENAANEKDAIYCKKGKKIVDGKCRKFKYDPLLRAPKSTGSQQQFSEEDFVL